MSPLLSYSMYFVCCLKFSCRARVFENLHQRFQTPIDADQYFKNVVVTETFRDYSQSAAGTHPQFASGFHGLHCQSAVGTSTHPQSASGSHGHHSHQSAAGTATHPQSASGSHGLHSQSAAGTSTHPQFMSGTHDLHSQSAAGTSTHPLFMSESHGLHSQSAAGTSTHPQSVSKSDSDLIAYFFLLHLILNLCVYKC